MQKMNAYEDKNVFSSTWRSCDHWNQQHFKICLHNQIFINSENEVDLSLKLNINLLTKMGLINKVRRKTKMDKMTMTPTNWYMCMCAWENVRGYTYLGGGGGLAGKWTWQCTWIVIILSLSWQIFLTSHLRFYRRNKKIYNYYFYLLNFSHHF